MTLIDVGGAIIDENLLLFFIIIVAAMLLSLGLVIRWRSGGREEVITEAYEFDPSGNTVAIPIPPVSEDTSHIRWGAGDQERHVEHSHPFTIIERKLRFYLVPRGGDRAIDPEGAYNRSFRSRSPAPLVQKQAHFMGRLGEKIGISGMSLRKYWFNYLMMILAGFGLGWIVHTYSVTPHP